MKAIVLKNFGSVDELEIADIADPQAGPGEVLIRTSAFSINPIDAKTRSGQGRAEQLKHERPIILGWDVSGTVIQTGDGVTELSKGSEVFGMINVPGHGKTYAQQVVAKVEQLALKPVNVSHREAAAGGLAAMTAYEALFVHASIQPGDKILIHAAAGGVGHFAVQFARHVLQAYVIGTSSAENKDFVLQIGANEHIDYHAQSFETVSPQVDWVLDAIGGKNIDKSLKVLKPGGTIISLPSGLSEAVGEKGAAQGKKGIHFRVQSNGDHMKKIAALLERGLVRPTISQVFPFDGIKDAHRQIETGKTKGKLVVSIK